MTYNKMKVLAGIAIHLSLAIFLVAFKHSGDSMWGFLWLIPIYLLGKEYYRWHGEVV